MNAFISMDHAEVQEAIAQDIQRKVVEIQHELDNLFRNKIKTPEQVIYVYDRLEQYRKLAGREYVITFEENSIV